MSKGRNPQTPNIEGLILHVREQNRTLEETDDFFLLFFFPLRKVPAQTGRPFVDPESPT